MLAKIQKLHVSLMLIRIKHNQNAAKLAIIKTIAKNNNFSWKPSSKKLYKAKNNVSQQ